MKIKCLHGYFIFEDVKPGDISDFMSRYGVDISSNGKQFTFTDLVDAPEYSIEGGTYLGAPASKTYEGEPWEVMRENELVYDFATGAVVPISSILNSVSLSNVGNFYTTSGMILPGSITDDGSRVTEYSAFLFNGQFRYTEVIIE